MLLIALGAFHLFVWQRVRHHVWGTTLQQPWCWLLAAVGLLVASHTAVTWGWLSAESNSGQAIRYAIVVSTYCPMMALLGAKRPQHRAWQWIVLTFWIVMCMPAIEFYLYQRGGWLRLPWAWQILLVVFTAMPVANYLPTRNLLAAVGFAAGQWSMVEPWIGHGESPAVADPQTGLVYFAAGLLGTWLMGRLIRAPCGVGPWRTMKPPAAHDGANAGDAEHRLWIAFRNSWGVLWALRVAERYDTLAAAQGGTTRLGWRGFYSISAADSNENLGGAGQATNNTASPAPSAPSTKLNTFRALLARFVSDRWLTDHAERDFP